MRDCCTPFTTNDDGRIDSEAENVERGNRYRSVGHNDRIKLANSMHKLVDETRTRRIAAWWNGFAYHVGAVDSGTASRADRPRR